MKLFHPVIRSGDMNRHADCPSFADTNFEETYRTHYRRVLALCRYLLKSIDEAEDAVQEVFLRAYEKRSTVDDSKSYLNWLLKIATNHCLDRLRRRSSEARIFETAAVDRVGPSGASEDTLEYLVRAEKGASVRAAIQSLPDKYRVPLVLAYYNRFTYDEIGKALELNRNTVATLLLRAKRRLRKELIGL